MYAQYEILVQKEKVVASLRLVVTTETAFSSAG